MKFNELNKLIPHATGEVHVMEMSPYKDITISLPGKHQDETDPIGGDFLVMITDVGLGWDKRQFSHNDLFKDFEKKHDVDPALVKILYNDYASLVESDLADPEMMLWGNSLPGIDANTLLAACQCLAICEHRRYARHEKRGGGKFLPLRFVAGIVYGKWTAAEAAAQQKRGRPGVEHLESLTK